MSEIYCASQKSKHNNPVPAAWYLLAVIAFAFVSMTGCGTMSHGHNHDGVSMYRQGHYQRAAIRFQQAIESNPGNPDGYYNVANLYHRQGIQSNDKSKLTQAETYYHLCLERNANDVDAHRSLAVLLVQQQRPEDAMSLLENWAAQNPSNPEPKIELARLSEEFGEREKATAHLTDALKSDPRNARALAALGKLREESGNMTQALANYNRSLQRNPYQAKVHARVASLQAARNRVDTPPSGSRTVSTPSPPRTVSNPTLRYK